MYGGRLSEAVEEGKGQPQRCQWTPGSVEEDHPAVLYGWRQPLGHSRVRPDRRQYGHSLGESEIDRSKGVVSPEVEEPEELITNSSSRYKRPPKGCLVEPDGEACVRVTFVMDRL
jgi:hypothetical protein